MIERLTPPEIAAQLGISRQRVYQILVEENVDYLTANRRHRLQRRISRNLARSLGPDAAYVDRNTRGEISELLAAADLLSLGWKPYVPLFRNRGHDLIVTKNRTVLSIEVRSALRRKDRSIAASEFTTGHRSDHFAFVLPDEPVIYKPPLPLETIETYDEKVTGGRRLMYTEKQIEEAAERFRGGERLKDIRHSVVSRAGKVIGEAQLGRRIAAFEEKKSAQHL